MLFAASLMTAGMLVPAPLLAHARLLRSEPAAGASLAESPRSLRLVFSERPVAELTRIWLTRANGDRFLLGVPQRDSADQRALDFALATPLAGGNWRVDWSTASRDGHVIKGSFNFTVEQSAPQAAAAEQPDSSPVGAVTEETPLPPALSGAFGAFATRWLAFLSLFAVIGVVAFRFGVLRRVGADEDADPFLHIASTNAASLGIAAAIALLVSALLRLFRESGDMPDVPLATMLLSTLWGWTWLAQCFASLAAAAAFRAIHKTTGRSRHNAWKVALAAALVLSITPALAGHAVSGDWSLIAVPADVIHVLAGSAWLGTLAVIVIVGISAALKTPEERRPGERVASLINVFSPLALVCGGTVLATGTVTSLINVSPLGALWTTPYGVTLIVKLLFVALLFGAGAWNWKRLKPRLTGDNALVPLRSMASLELVIAGVVLGITAVLVALELP